MSLTPEPLSLAQLVDAVRAGWRDYRMHSAASTAYASVFLVFGALVLAALLHLGLAPLAMALAGAFMLFGPVSLAGFLTLRQTSRGGSTMEHLALALTAMLRVDRSVWAMGGFCAFMALVWLTDAGTLYSFLVGKRHSEWIMTLPQWVHRHFHGSSLLMGGALALIVFVVSVHSVPLMLRTRMPLVPAVAASVRAVGRSPVVHLLWGFLLAAFVMGSILLFPLLLVTLPVAAFASDRITSSVFLGAAGT